MATQHLNRILCAGQAGDSSNGAERILDAASGIGADVIALVRDLAHDPPTATATCSVPSPAPLKVLDPLDYNELVMLFATAIAHKGHNTPGREAVAELVGTYRPGLVVCGGPRGVEILGTSLGVAPGSLADGHYAVAEVHAGTAELAELSIAAG